MSRYTITVTSSDSRFDPDAVIGYDPPLRTFFLQAFPDESGDDLALTQFFTNESIRGQSHFGHHRTNVDLFHHGGLLHVDRRSRRLSRCADRGRRSSPGDDVQCFRGSGLKVKFARDFLLRHFLSENRLQLQFFGERRKGSLNQQQERQHPDVKQDGKCDGHRTSSERLQDTLLTFCVKIIN